MKSLIWLCALAGDDPRRWQPLRCPELHLAVGEDLVLGRVSGGIETAGSGMIASWTSLYREALILVIARERFRDDRAGNASLNKGVRVYIGAYADLGAETCHH